MSEFAVYLHPETVAVSRPLEQVQFMGHSVPHFSQVREALEQGCRAYQSLPLRQAAFEAYGRIHTAAYLKAIQQMALDQKPDFQPELSVECRGFEYCLPGYSYGLGGLMEAIDWMKHGTLDRAYCFTLGGHHAYADSGHGYCLLNPQAAAVRYAQEQGFRNVAVIDWDIHHGDGTQSIFAHDKTVYCISIHSGLDLYMMKMAGHRAGSTIVAEEVGHCNIPLIADIFDTALIERVHFESKYYRSAESMSVFEAALDTIPWQADLILIFSGYDSHRDDCGKGITDWTDEHFRLLTELVLKKAAQFGCPVLSSHGGGYKLPVTVSAALTHIHTLASYSP